MRILIFCILLLSSCASKEFQDIPNSITVDSGSFVFLEPEKAGMNGYLIDRKNKQLLVYGLPYVNEDTVQRLGDYELFILRKDFGESRIEITDQNLVSPKIKDQKRASAEYLKVKKIIKNKTKQFDNSFEFQSPIESVITSAYGKRRFINNNERSPHMALDLRGAVGREIFAPKTGKVVLAEKHFYGGNKVILDHGLLVAQELAHVLSGGDTTIDKTLSEDDLYKLELDAFMRLIETKQTQDRIKHTLATGKPLVN